MKKNQFFPFVRNRYYAGKLLTASDFEAEQLYMNNKRRFLNFAMFGSGIVCGLNVVKIDDLSILVESGAAIDSAGREIVIPSDVIKKLSGVEGYENIKTDRVKLFLRYKEDNVHMVYSGDMGTERQELESNHIDEGYELYLQDADQSDTHKPVDNNLFLKERLLDNDDYTIFLSMPQTVAKGQAVKIVVNICKNSDAGKELSFKAELQLPAFSDNRGRHELNISVRDLAMAQGQTIQKEYWINSDYIEAKETNIVARKEDMQFTIGGYEVEPTSSLNLKVFLAELSPYKLAASEVGKTSLEDSLKSVSDSGICIAELGLLRNDVSCHINDVTEQGVKQYITTPGKMEQRDSFMLYFKNNGELERLIQGGQSEIQAGINSVELPTFMTSGRLEIPLDVNMKKGDVCYSEEIMHGLGKGNVYVEVGMEYLDDDPHSMNNRRNTIYGNPELFKFRECMEIETAVRVMNDKGSFQVAAKLLGEQKSIVIQLNWVAVKFTSMKDAAEMQEEDNRAIIPETPTVRLKARESYYFNVNFSNMKPCRLSYELTEAGSGEIGADGLYTAPSKEGVYEIYIYCTDMPKISTYVYAVVSK